jgi:hypothetical protein
MRFVSCFVVSAHVTHIHHRDCWRTLSISCWSFRAAMVTAGRRLGVIGVQPYLVQMRCDAAVGGLENMRYVSVGGPVGRGMCFVRRRSFERQCGCGECFGVALSVDGCEVVQRTASRWPRECPTVDASARSRFEAAAAKTKHQSNIWSSLV